MRIFSQIFRFFHDLWQRRAQKRRENKARRELISKRACGHSLPYVDAAKRYGNLGEEELTNLLLTDLPSVHIKRNVVIETSEGNAEIDCLLLYRDRLFAIEIKTWSGYITETKDGFLQEKTDQYTSKIHTKVYKSPIKQLSRAIYLLKKQIPIKAWITPVVFFVEAEGVELMQDSDAACFTEYSDLVRYVRTAAEPSMQARAFFRSCVAGDVLYGIGYEQKNVGVIDRSTLIFSTDSGRTITADRILSIDVSHTQLYDTLHIQETDGVLSVVRERNRHIRVCINGITDSYALSKIDRIELGRSHCP